MEIQERTLGVQGLFEFPGFRLNLLVASRVNLPFGAPVFEGHITVVMDGA